MTKGQEQKALVPAQTPNQSQVKKSGQQSRKPNPQNGRLKVQVTVTEIQKHKVTKTIDLGNAIDINGKLGTLIPPRGAGSKPLTFTHKTLTKQTVNAKAGNIPMEALIQQFQKNNTLNVVPPQKMIADALNQHNDSSGSINKTKNGFKKQITSSTTAGNGQVHQKIISQPKTNGELNKESSITPKQNAHGRPQITQSDNAKATTGNPNGKLKQNDSTSSTPKNRNNRGHPKSNRPATDKVTYSSNKTVQVSITHVP
ncbi:hypothetical protein O181_111243 [Austropuccinia psidii MF-1]|uniref:Uncharacterized protein n=1 Tax=Austropuccinia psidii MF-1 TaxID=1389203 RepID=A0A9Q3JZ56_9BASI|nr:hypothetical protein [Austropuccinia psidii MF-1]